MGLIAAPEFCFITNQQTKDIPSDIDRIDYSVSYFGKVIKFVFNPRQKNSSFVNDNLYILRGLILNNKIDFSKIEKSLNNDLLEQIILEAIVPKSPKSKLENLLLFLYENQEFEGSIIKLEKYPSWEIVLFINYMKSQHEFHFYLKTLKDYGFVDFMDTTTKDGPSAINIRMTFSGLEYVIELQEGGQNSKKCFVAMSFSYTEKITAIRKTLKTTIKKQGYEPILIDEMHYDSGQTINDAMLNFIKQSKFLVADFTEHKHGVYFEAGYALGLKKPVIYTCHSEYFKLTHFDTNHYPHIVYENLTDLEVKLENKIAAWID